jgi:predicted DNA-binding transcriptional regulator YafY
MTAQALAAELDVSVRTIYRDVEALGAAGVPVYADRGAHGGFQLVDGYRTRLTGLNPDEAEALLLIGLPGPAEALGLGAATTSARGKLLAALPVGIGVGADKIAARFHLDPVDWYRAQEVDEHLPLVARAVLDQHPVLMTYTSWTGVRSWRVEPLGVVLKGGSWYLVAGTHAGIRTFKVRNIRTAAASDGTFSRPVGFDLARHWARELARFEEDLRPQTCLVRASLTGRRRLARLGAYAEHAVDAADPPDRSGWARVRLPIEGIDDAALVLLGIGPEVEILEPPELRARVCDLATAVLDRTRPVPAPGRC